MVTQTPPYVPNRLVIRPSATADTRTCDFKTVTKEQLLHASMQHIGDVRLALSHFAAELHAAGERHDFDKVADIDGFHRDFVAGFQEPNDWWRAHKRLNRHHLMDMAGNLVPDGIREDVDLIDVLDYIADGVMAGMARSGEVKGFQPSPELAGLLLKAFTNTVEKLKALVVVETPTT